MRILFLTSRVPDPPVRGDKVRTHGFLRALSAQHDVRLITFAGDRRDLELAEGLRSLCDVQAVLLPRARSVLNMLAAVPSRRPFQSSYYASRPMTRAVHAALAEWAPDVVYVHLFRMAQFVLDGGGGGGLLRTGDRPPYVLDLTDAISTELALSIPYRPLLFRAPYGMELARVRAYEGMTAGLFDEAWVISEADRREILALAPCARVEVVPNGVDERLFEVERAKGEPPVVLFVGNLSVPHNVDAVRVLAEEIAPRVRSRVPQAVFRIVGHSDRGLASRLAGRPGISVVGFVPDLADAYGSAAVFAAPLRFAAGVQNKILEAMAAGLPVVTTSAASRGLAARPDHDVLVRDDPDAFAAALAGLLEDEEARRALGERGRGFVERDFGWRRVLDRVEALHARGRGVAPG